jgi:type I restriction enzyme S subunit
VGFAKDMKVDIIDETPDAITVNAVTESSTKLIPSNSVLMVVRSGI